MLIGLRDGVRGLEHPDESLGTSAWRRIRADAEGLGGLICIGRALAGAPNLATMAGSGALCPGET